MRTIKAIGIPLLAILVGCTMLVGAVSICLSNVVENENSVGLPITGLAITLSILPTTSTPDGDLPDYTSGQLLMGQKYDMLISYTTTKAFDAGKIIVEFSKADIVSTDVAMSWTDGEDPWVAMAWNDSVAGVLTGTLGAVGTHPANSETNYFAHLTYTVTGDFTFNVWVEGELA